MAALAAMELPKAMSPVAASRLAPVATARGRHPKALASQGPWAAGRPPAVSGKEHHGSAAAAAAALVAVAGGARRRPRCVARLQAAAGAGAAAPAGAQRGKCRVVMVGAGPGGLALACALTQMEKFEVLILETRSAKQTSAATGRSHSIGLGRRAREALVAIGGQELWEALTARGMVAGGFTLHLNGFPLRLPAPEGEPVVLVDRGEMTRALRDFMTGLPCAPGASVTVQHSARVKSVDLVSRHVVVESSEDGAGDEAQAEVIPYDLLLGSDGVRSRVRAAMSEQLPSGCFESELRLMPGRWQALRIIIIIIIITYYY